MLLLVAFVYGGIRAHQYDAKVAAKASAEIASTVAKLNRDLSAAITERDKARAKAVLEVDNVVKAAPAPAVCSLTKSVADQLNRITETQ